MAALFLAFSVGAYATAVQVEEVSAGGSGKTEVACYPDLPPGAGGDAKYKVKPYQCSFYRRGAQSNSDGAVHTKNIDWNWGRSHAGGRGTAFISTVGPTDVVVDLSRPETRCGHRVFTKITYKYPEFGSDEGDFKLASC